MTTEPDPTLDDAPLESAVQAEAEAAAEGHRPTAETAARPADAACGRCGARRRDHRPARELWSARGSSIFSGLILIAAGLVAAGAAYVSSARDRRLARRSPCATSSWPAARSPPSLGILYRRPRSCSTSTIVDSYGGIIGLVLTFALAIAGVVLYFAATRWWSGGPAAPWTTALAAGDRATKLVLLGAALVLVGWLGNVTIGFWYLGARRRGHHASSCWRRSSCELPRTRLSRSDCRSRRPSPRWRLSIIAAIIAFQHTSGDLSIERRRPRQLDRAACCMWPGVVIVVGRRWASGSAEGLAHVDGGADGRRAARLTAELRPRRAARARSRIGAPTSAVPFGDDLGQDREGRLGRCTPAEVEPDRPAQPARSASLTPASSRRARRSAWVLLRADRADVAAAAPERLDDRGLIELDVVATGPRPRRSGRARSPRPPRPASRRPGDRPRGSARAWRMRPGHRRRRSRSRARARAGRASARPRRHRRRRAAGGPGRPR